MSEDDDLLSEKQISTSKMAWQRICRDQHGQLVLQEILDLCGEVVSVNTHQQMAFDAGRASVGFSIRTRIPSAVLVEMLTKKLGDR